MQTRSGRRCGGPLDRPRGRAVPSRERGPEVEVREVSDPKSVKGLWQVRNRNLDDASAQPAGLNPAVPEYGDTEQADHERRDHVGSA